MPNAEPVRKISIISRGMAAGYTLKVPKEDRSLRTKSEFEAELAVLLAGYVSEKIKFRDTTTGASDDLAKASQLARSIVKTYGMSSMGPIVFGEKETDMFWGNELGESRNYSDEVALEIDNEVKKLISRAEKEAGRVIKQKKAVLDKLAKTLMEKETIEKEEFEKIVKTKRKK